ncbi:MAG TPA: helix-turn-helix transcriptional regulator [Thermoanaerobaculia bacterium]|nr:helix-turn-helix transcriptional regulator [Thermoanaerobaculia bacterium]
MNQSGNAGRKPGKKYVMISVVAEQLSIHPQTIRLYEREGLITPTRSAGNTRLYDEEAIRRLETILTLTRDMGINLAGVEVILGLKDRIEELRAEVDRLREDLRQFTNDERAGVDRRFALVQIKSGLPVKR